MLRIIVDSGSSIKQEEKTCYDCEILPLKILLGDIEYEDGIDLTMEHFYDCLINYKLFPKTSLPSLKTLEDLLEEYNKNNDDVIILTISSGISGTYNSIRMLCEDMPNVRVVDTLSAVGGIRLMVNEINKMKDNSLDEIVNHLNKFKKRIRILAIPETLTYLHRGGRLSKAEYILGSIIGIRPIIGIENGKVKSFAKKRGIKNAMKYIAEELELKCDLNYEIIASYTYNKDNINKLITYTDSVFHDNIKVFDDLDPAIACHWGPNAFGYVFIEKE